MVVSRIGGQEIGRPKDYKGLKDPRDRDNVVYR
jgi:hypothetical protein